MAGAHVRSTAVLDGLPSAEAEHALLACCASPSWARSVAAGRPYRDEAALLDAADRTLAALPWSELEAVLAAHPRIGERPAGTGQEARWSSREQSGVDGARESTRAALATGNAAYERRFGHLYLVRAAGRSADELLSLLTHRLGNDVATERTVVRAELWEITQLRLSALLTGSAP